MDWSFLNNPQWWMACVLACFILIGRLMELKKYLSTAAQTAETPPPLGSSARMRILALLSMLVPLAALFVFGNILAVFMMVLIMVVFYAVGMMIVFRFHKR